MRRLSWNLGASAFWNPQGLSRAVMRLLYLYSRPKDYPDQRRLCVDLLCLSSRFVFRCTEGPRCCVTPERFSGTRKTRRLQNVSALRHKLWSVPSQKKWQNWKELMMANYWNNWQVKTAWMDHKAFYTTTWTGLPCSMNDRVMRRLTTGIRSEKCVVRRFRRCANVIIYTNLDSIDSYTPSLYGIAYCS